jgi:hypothetical protein
MFTRSGKIFNNLGNDIINLFFKTTHEGFPIKNMAVSNLITLKKLSHILQKRTGFKRIYCYTFSSKNQNHQNKSLFEMGMNKGFEWYNIGVKV